MKQSTLVVLAGALALSACSGTDEPTDAPLVSLDPTIARPCPPRPPLVSRVDPATVAECPHGGAVVRSGPDRDRDGILDDREIATTNAVCAEPPAATLTRVDTIAPGAECLHGGSLVRSGLDADRDGALDDAEVTATSTVCAPSGELWTGDARIASLDDVRRLAGVSVILGDLIITDTRLTSTIALPALAFVGGHVTVTGADLPGLELPRLARVAGDVTLRASTIARLDAPLLARVGGSLRASDLATLETLDLPALARVGGDLAIGKSATLTSLRAPLLAGTGNAVSIVGAPLTELDLGALRSAAIVTIKGTDLTSISLPGPHYGIELEGAHLASAAVCGSRISVRGPVAQVTALCDGADMQLSVEPTPSVTRLAIAGMSAGRQFALLQVKGAGVVGVDLDQPDGAASVKTLTIEAPIEALPAIDVVERLSLTGTRLTDLTCGAVRQLGLYTNPQLQRVTCDAVGDVLSLFRNPALETVTLQGTDARPAALPQGIVSIIENPRLTALSPLPEQTAVDIVTIDGSPLLAVPTDWAVDGSALTLRDVPGLRSLHATGIGLFDVKLERTGLTSVVVEPTSYINLAVAISDNADLVSADIVGPFMSLDGATITQNPALHHLTIGEAAYAYEIHIVDNASLPACEAQAILDSFEADIEEQSGNDDDAPECRA